MILGNYTFKTFAFSEKHLLKKNTDTHTHTLVSELAIFFLHHTIHKAKLFSVSHNT